MFALQVTGYENHTVPTLRTRSDRGGLSGHSAVSDSPSFNDVRRMTLVAQEVHFLVWRQSSLRTAALRVSESGEWF